MNKTRFDVVLSEKSIQDTVNKLKAYECEFQKKIDRLIERLAIIGGKEASIRFSTAIYDGLNDSNVSVEPIKTGWKIVAKGDAVCFIEFGSGVYHNPTEPYPNTRPSRVSGIGEYGKGKGKQNTWGYYGNPGTNGEIRTNKKGEQVVITHGNPASMPMWYASQEMQHEILAIAREVFG